MKKRKKTKVQKLEMFHNWLKLVYDDKGDSGLLECPRCKENAVDYLYIGDKKDMVGYLQTWCNSCNYGIHFSRLIMPEGPKTRDFKDDHSDLVDLIPRFIHLNPYK